VLHGLRVKGFAEAEALAAAVGIDGSDVEGELKSLADDGLVLHREGRVSGWSLTPEGRQRHALLVASELTAAGVRDDVEACYRRFLAINPDLLATCTAWQLRPGEGGQSVNDHSDPAYDASVVERLAGLHARVRPITDDLGRLLERLAGYGPRLDRALAQVRGGAHE
jgi:DNA-binding MarR family transcriptional regulator